MCVDVDVDDAATVVAVNIVADDGVALVAAPTDVVVVATGTPDGVADTIAISNVPTPAKPRE